MLYIQVYIHVIRYNNNATRKVNNYSQFASNNESKQITQIRNYVAMGNCWQTDSTIAVGLII